MTEPQLSALIELMGDRMSPAMRDAMREVLVHGKEQKAAALRFGVNTGPLCERIRLARKKLKLAYKAITGVDYEDPQKGKQ